MPFKLIALSLLFFTYTQCFPYDVTDGTELVFAFMVLRHGDRTPLHYTLRFSTDPEALAAKSEPYGPEQLTNKGKQRSYELGEKIRKRYHEILPEKYNVSRVYIRSTDLSRTQMTILAALSNIFPVTCEHDWSQKMKWTPVPYTTVPEAYDFLAFSNNCPVYMNYRNKSLKSQPKSMVNEKNLEALAIVSKYSHVNVTQYPVHMYMINDIYESQVSLDIPLPAELYDIHDEIRRLAGEALDVLQGNEDYINLGSGPLLNEFYTHAYKIINGTGTPTVRIYSGHDFNVYALQAATKIINKQGVPYYNAVYSLELRRVKNTGRYVVLPVYYPGFEVEERPIYLQMEGCDLLCDFDSFVRITSGYALTEKEWRTKCEWNYDI